MLKGNSNASISSNCWQKYHSKNPIQIFLISRFLTAVQVLLKDLKDSCKTAIDVGCGEGLTTSLLRDVGYNNLLGVDLSQEAIKVAQNSRSDISFKQTDVYNLSSRYQADLVCAFEVLEHLEHPGKALKQLALVAQKYCLLSVPNEPLFRVLNFLAGKYWGRWGSSPGHLNHWSVASFKEMIEQYFIIEKIELPLPWILVVARPRK